MKYLIVQDWDSTHGNHAGMVHMCNLLKERYPNEYEVIIHKNPFRKPKNILDKIINRLMPLFVFVRYRQIAKGISKNLKPGDRVFLLEYLCTMMPQYGIASYLKRKCPDIGICALSHYTPSYFRKLGFSKEKIERWAKPVDKMMTLGSSLSEYFKSNGISEKQISTGFHYVDMDYYCNCLPITHDKIKCVVIGALQRDYNLVAEIVKNTQKVHWEICLGRQKIQKLFEACDNVTLHGYIEEDELKKIMSESDISVNVMEDTVGSNVITTSMAMGLAMVVSDVGSIRDYCDESNAIFCDNAMESFVSSINRLAESRDRIYEMKKNSSILAKRFSIQNVNLWFSSL